jgi:hypothetical protein
MKKVFYTALAVFSLCAMSACEKQLEVKPADQPKADGELKIRTRSASNDLEVSYPVIVYVMNSEGTCVSRETVVSAESALSIDLPSGEYNVYAVAGATEDSYTLPTMQTATPTSELLLKENAKHGDLMAASSTITLGKNETNQLTLNLARKVMKVTSLTINDVPADVTAVTITFSPLSSSLRLNGTFNTTATSQTVSLTKQADETTWKNSESLFLLPQTGSTTITIGLTKGEQTTYYSYACQQTLDSNHELTIAATYAGDRKITMTGSINGVAWGDPIDITFEFGEDNTSDNKGGDSNSSSDEVPEVHSVYKDCYVLSVADDGNDKVVTLLHKNAVAISGSGKTEAAVSAEIDAALPSFIINGITGWRIPTRADLNDFNFNIFNAAISSVSDAISIGTTSYYYYLDGEHLKCFRGNNLNLGYVTGDHFRPVTTVRFSK